VAHAAQCGKRPALRQVICQCQFVVDAERNYSGQVGAVPIAIDIGVGSI
jgi:hypothetical protein